MQAYISQAVIPTKFGWNEAVIGEDANGKIRALILEGEFQKAESQNRNGRMYSEQLLTRETNKLKQFITERNGLPMGMDHPLPGDSESAMVLVQRMGMENACALCVELDMSNKVVYGKSRIIEGDHGTGDKLASMVRAGFKPGVSSRGMGGKPVHQSNGIIMVPEDYNMITYDFVTSPSTFNAILQEQVNEEIALWDEAQPKTQKVWEVLTDLSKKYI